MTAAPATDGVCIADLNDGQTAAANRVLDWADDPDGPRFMALIGPAGCHAPGTLIRLFDGGAKKVEEVAVGDLLLGPDSQPREVLNLVYGSGDMVRVSPVKGDSFVVNLDHVLTLRRSYGNGDLLVDVPVREWLHWGVDHKKRYKLWRTGADFPPRNDLTIDPYFLGLLLGDGGMTQGVMVSKPDTEVRAEVHAQAEAYGLYVAEYHGKDHRMMSHNRGPGANALITALRALGLYPIDGRFKFIPKKYRVASRVDRLSLLAGLLDSDGSLSGANGYDFINKSPWLANDLCFVARSLGFAAYFSVCEKGCQTGARGQYFRVSLSGDLAQVPVRIPRRQASVRRQIKNVGHTGFSIQSVGPGDFFGFTLSGDGRYLMHDFTVTHNSGKTSLLKIFADEWKRRVKWAGMTGRAARRMREAAGLRGATTFHRAIYGRAEEIDNAKRQRIDLRFSEVRRESDAILVIDEASMMDRKQFQDAASSRYRKILLVGDGWQIPPVSEDGDGDWSVFREVDGPHLTEVMRTAGAIVEAATIVRERREIPRGRIQHGGSDYECTGDFRTALRDWFGDRDDHVLITWTNAARMRLNLQIRQVLGINSPIPAPGEPVVVRRNNHAAEMMNGDIFYVDDWLGDGPEIAGVKTRYVRLRETPYPPLPVASADAIGDVDGRPKMRSALVPLQGRECPFDGAMPYVGLAAWKAALAATQVDETEIVPISWAYVLTGHLVQGSQYRRATTLLFRDMKSRNFRKPTALPDGTTIPFAWRFIYTCLSRAIERSVLVTE